MHKTAVAWALLAGGGWAALYAVGGWGRGLARAVIRAAWWGAILLEVDTLPLPAALHLSVGPVTLAAAGLWGAAGVALLAWAHWLFPRG